MKSLASVLALPPGPKATAALAAWVQALFEEPAQVPVLVGGAAVELYTSGAYTTGDLDFVGPVPPAVARKLEAAGFRREGRNWIHSEGEVFLEFPGSKLQEGETVARLRAGGHVVLVLGLDEILVDRLAAWSFWKSDVDGIAAFELWRRRFRSLDRRRLRHLAAERGVESGLRRLERFAGKWRSRRPRPEELARWAKQG